MEEETRNQRLEAIKRKRKETVEAVKRDLKKKFSERKGIKNLDLQKGIKTCEKEMRERRDSTNERGTIKIKNDLLSIFQAGIDGVHPIKIMQKKILFDREQRLSINGVNYNINNNVHMVGWGQEAVMLGATLERMINFNLKSGCLIVPEGTVSLMGVYPSWLPLYDTHINYVELKFCNDSVDEKYINSMKRLVSRCKELTKDDILIVILSTGAEDLICYAENLIDTDEKIYIVNKLRDKYASELEINIVRNALSSLRGGNLAKLAYPAKVITLIMSNVLLEPYSMIAGGPTAYGLYKSDALKILDKYNITNILPTRFTDILRKKENDNHLLDQNGQFSFVDFYIIANTNDALNAMEVAAFNLGLISLKVFPMGINYPKIIAKEYAKLVSLLILAAEGMITKMELYNSMIDSPTLSLSEETVHRIFPSKENWGLGLCLLSGGHVKENSLDDFNERCPNQETALYFSLYWFLKKAQYPIFKKYSVWFLGGNTAGRDGNTDVSGACGYDSLITEVYQRFKDLSDQCREAHLRFCELSVENPRSEDFKEALKQLKQVESEREKVQMILPDQVLHSNNVNSFYQSINNGDDLFQVGDARGYTFTNIGDLHIIKIARFSI